MHSIKTTLCTECRRGSIFFLDQPSITLVLLTKKTFLDFSIGFLGQNKLCDQQEFMILTCFLHLDDLHN